MNIVAADGTYNFSTDFINIDEVTCIYIIVYRIREGNADASNKILALKQ